MAHNRNRSRRKKAWREMQPVVLVVCEGKETERIYFTELRREVRLKSMKVKIPKTNERDPLNLVRYATKLISDEGYSMEYGDTIWLVFDMDANPLRVKIAFLEAKKHGYNVILSIPSVELWYLLHYRYTETRMDSKEVLCQLKRYFPNYNKTDQNVPHILRAMRGKALENAKKLLEHHKTEGHDLYDEESNPITHIFELVEFILDVS